MERETPLLSGSHIACFPPASPGGRPFRIKLTAADQGPELRSCVKVEVAVLSSPSLKVLMVSVDGKQQ